MTTSLHTLQAAPHRHKKRLGRGNGSGRGTYAGRGMKGQKARTGHKRIESRALKSLYVRLPKLGGFQSLRPKASVVDLTTLSNAFSAGAVVTPASLRKKKLIGASTKTPVKILSNGTLTHALTIKGCKVSAGALEKIIAAGGTVSQKSHA